MSLHKKDIFFNKSLNIILYLLFVYHSIENIIWYVARIDLYIILPIK